MYVSSRCLCLSLGRISICIFRTIQKDAGLQCLSPHIDAAAAAAAKFLFKGTKLAEDAAAVDPGQGPVMKFMRNVCAHRGTVKVV